MGKRGSRAPKGGKRLRARTESVFGGYPRGMSELQLPLWKDVGLHLENLEEGGMARPEALKKTAEKVGQIYQGASINCLPINSILRKVKTLLSLKRNHEIASVVDKRTGKVRDQGKRRRRKKGNNKCTQKLSDVAGTIFEVKLGEVPEIEMEFYQDQCGPRKMVIGKLDTEETGRRTSLLKKELAAQQSREKKEAAMRKFREKEEERKKLLFKKVTWDEVGAEETAVEESGDKGEEEGEVRLGTRGQIWLTASGKRRRFSVEDLQFLGEVLETCDRFDVSSTAASTLFNLHASSSKSDLRVNQSQVAKLKRKFRLQIADNFKPVNQPEAIGFDERKDVSKCVVGVGQDGHKRFEKKRVLFT